MSIDATRWAWMQVLKPTAKLVLLSLADRAGDDHSCFPSIKRLEKDTGINRKTVMKNIQYLSETGLIVVIKNHGNSNRYRLMGVGEPLKKSESYPQPVPKVGRVVVPKVGLVPIVTQYQKWDKGSTYFGTRVVPKMGLGVSQKWDTNLSINLSSNLSVNQKAHGINFSNLPEGVSVELAEKYILNRKKLGAGTTQRVFDSVMREVMAANVYGFSPAEALQVAIERDWIRMKAWWFKNVKRLGAAGRQHEIEKKNQQAIDDFVNDDDASIQGEVCDAK